MLTNHHDHKTDRTPDGSDQLRQGTRQMTDGALRAASGAKNIFSTRLAPAAKQAAERTKSAFDAHSADAGGTLPLLTRYAPTALLVAAGLYVLGLFLPMHKGESYMTGPLDDGPIVLLMLAAVVALNIANHKLRVAKKGLRIASGVTAIIVGLLGVLGGFGNMPNLGVSLGALAIGFAGLGLIVAGTLVWINKKAPADQ